jgi:hypothetical protein
LTRDRCRETMAWGNLREDVMLYGNYIGLIRYFSSSSKNTNNDNYNYNNHYYNSRKTAK